MDEVVTGSASKIARFRRCKHAFFYSDILGVQRVTKSIAPSRGTLLHKCLQTYYSGGDWAQPIRDFKIDYDKLFDEERAEWGDLPKEAYRIMRGYLLAYKSSDAMLKTLGTEVHFTFSLDGSKERLYQGYIDWIYEDAAGQIWVADHKTVKTIPNERELYMDMPTLLYFEACRKSPELIELLKGRTPAGVVFNHIRTKAPKEPQVLKSGAISKAACDTDVATYFETVKKNGLNPEDYRDMLDKLRDNVFFKRTRIPATERTIKILVDEAKRTEDEIATYTRAWHERLEAKNDASPFTRTQIRGRCSWDCEFAPLCFAELAGMGNGELGTMLGEQYEKKTSRESEDASTSEE